MDRFSFSYKVKHRLMNIMCEADWQAQANNIIYCASLYTDTCTQGALMSVCMNVYMCYEFIYGQSMPTMMYAHECIWFEFSCVFSMHPHVFTVCISVFLHYTCIYV